MKDLKKDITWIQGALKAVRETREKYKEGKYIGSNDCPLCIFSRGDDNCNKCPWLIFENKGCADGPKSYSDQPIFERITRLDRWEHELIYLMHAYWRINRTWNPKKEDVFNVGDRVMYIGSGNSVWEAMIGNCGTIIEVDPNGDSADVKIRLDKEVNGWPEVLIYKRNIELITPKKKENTKMDYQKIKIVKKEKEEEGVLEIDEEKMIKVDYELGGIIWRHASENRYMLDKRLDWRIGKVNGEPCLIPTIKEAK